MAKATVQCYCPNCGTTFDFSTSHASRAAANAWEVHANKNRLCSVCYKQQAREKNIAELRNIIDKYDLPRLAGSTKQISYAEDLRLKYLRQYRAMAQKFHAICQHRQTAWKIPAFLLRGQPESDCQGTPVSQNEICQRKHDIQFCGLFSQTSVSCFSVS